MLSAKEVDFIDDIFNQLGSELKITEDVPDKENEIFNYLDKTLLLQGYQDVYFHKSMKVLKSKTESHLLVTKVDYSIPSGKFNLGDYELQLIGLKKLNRNYGHIFIRPETISDKILELLKKTEIDFRDYPEFSSKYHFLSNDKRMAHSFATSQRLTLMEFQNELLVEVFDDVLIAKYSRLLNADDCSSMLGFIKNI